MNKREENRTQIPILMCVCLCVVPIVIICRSLIVFVYLYYAVGRMQAHVVICIIFTAGAAIWVARFFYNDFVDILYSQFLLWKPVAVAPIRVLICSNMFESLNVRTVRALNLLLPVCARSLLATEISLRAKCFKFLYLFCNDSIVLSHFCKIRFEIYENIASREKNRNENHIH